MIKVGAKIDNFKLLDQKGQEFTLASFVGKRVLFSFHPLAWTNICAKQMQSLEAHRQSLSQKNAIAEGISVDSVPCKAAWAKELKIEHTSLLSDFWPHGGFAKSLDVFRDNDGISERANIIIDEKGIVTFVKVYPIEELPDIEQILEAL